MRLPPLHSLKGYALVGVICFFVGAVLGFFGPSCADRKTTGILPSIDSQVAVHDVKTEVPVKALDKQELKRRSAISRAVADNKDAEVMATGHILDSSGSRTVAAVLDTKTGDTQLIQKRPLAEWMHRWEAGLGYGLVDGNIAKGAQARYNFGRIWEAYGTVQAEAFDVDRADNRHPWTLMIWGSVKF